MNIVFSKAPAQTFLDNITVLYLSIDTLFLEAKSKKQMIRQTVGEKKKTK